MKIVNLDLNNTKQLNKLMPLYFNYESELTKLKIEEIFDQEKPEENELYFINYFSRGINTLLLIDEDDILGFISYNIDSDDVPGYANGYKGFGHIAEIYIDNIYRNKGYAKKLVQSVELIFEKSKINDMYLVDINQNENLWKSLNYINTGIIEPEENGIIFTKKLKISK